MDFPQLAPRGMSLSPFLALFFLEPKVGRHSGPNLSTDTDYTWISCSLSRPGTHSGEHYGNKTCKSLFRKKICIPSLRRTSCFFPQQGSLLAKFMKLRLKPQIGFTFCSMLHFPLPELLTPTRKGITFEIHLVLVILAVPKVCKASLCSLLEVITGQVSNPCCP